MIIVGFPFFFFFTSFEMPPHIDEIITISSNSYSKALHRKGIQSSHYSNSKSFAKKIETK